VSDRIDHLVGQLEALAAEPVSAHPLVLDEVHRGLVGELDRLAGVVAGDGAGSSRQSHAEG